MCDYHRTYAKRLINNRHVPEVTCKSASLHSSCTVITQDTTLCQLNMQIITKKMHGEVEEDGKVEEGGEVSAAWNGDRVSLMVSLPS